jgi:hypothetical protein
MKRIYRYAFFVTLGAFVITISVLFADFTPPSPGKLATDITTNHEGPQVQLAILLDTSGSMSGLINQAKAYLWNIVNELSESEKNGKTPALYVSLYEYGKETLPASHGHMRQVVPLSRDLDHIYEELFRLTTNGGDEYCGMVIERAVEELPWSNDEDDLKLIFIAGNEPFTQGEVDYKTACTFAVKRGIVVNTVHCGNRNDGINGFWHDGAIRGSGTYMNIDHNQEIADIAAPQDEEIAALNEILNTTYIPYGNAGEACKERQAVQDTNALSMNKGILIQRAAAKSTSNYSNGSWDLVDAVKNKSVSLKDVKESDLPEHMRKMSADEKEQYIKDKLEERTQIQKNIRRLYEEREAYAREQMSIRSLDNSLEQAMMTALEEQAENKGYVFKK